MPYPPSKHNSLTKKISWLIFEVPPPTSKISQLAKKISQLAKKISQLTKKISQLIF